MKKHQTTLYLLIGILALGFSLSAQNISTKNLPKDISHCGYCYNIFPEANYFSLKQNNPALYEAYKIYPTTNKKTFLGLIFLTQDFAPNIHGYNGPILMAVGINPNNEITKIHIISHKETSNYLFNLPSFLKQFEKKKVTDSFTLGQDIDAMTQATITSAAITESIKQNLEKIYGTRQKIAKKNISYSEVLFLLIIFALGCGGFLFLNSSLRWLALSISLFYLGFIKANMFSDRKSVV